MPPIDPNAPNAADLALNKAVFEVATGIKLEPPKARALPAHEAAEMKADFRKFLFRLFEHLGHTPSDLQYDIARYLQHGPRRSIVCGFRGVGKSWITAAYAIWVLYVDPQKKVLVVSASGARAAMFVNFCVALINEVPFLKHLQPGRNQRQSSVNFDVGPSRPDQQPSLRALGITSQLPGNRADVIIPDDVETPQTAGTTTQREKLLEAIKEFGAIIKPGGRIVYLGTPQTEETIYVKLEQRGYSMRIWPSEYPDDRRVRQYGARLAPYIKNLLASYPDRVGHTTEPRFSDEDLQERKIEWGRAGYALQFMLDTSLSDEDRYPLRLHDLIVTGVDRERGPNTISWGMDEALIAKDLPMVGFDRDRFYRPASVSRESAKYDLIAGFLDPSGRGADETAITIGGGLNGRVFVMKTKGWRDGFSEGTLAEIAALCVEYRVKLLRIESNFGDGMYAKLLKPHLDKAWDDFNKGKPPGAHGMTGVEEERAGITQKELRILEVLGPATQQHRVVVNSEVIQQDYEDAQKLDIENDKRLQYSMIWQYSHLTQDRDCLPHDDRVESLAGLVSIFADALGINPGKAAKERDKNDFLKEWKEFMRDAVTIGGNVPDKDPSNGRGFRPKHKAQRIRR